MHNAVLTGICLQPWHFRPAVLVIKDDDFGFEDDVLGVAEVDLAEAECIQNPRHPVSMAIKLMPGDSLGNAEDLKARPRA